MIVVALICFTFIASGSCQLSDNNVLKSRLIDTPQFKRYLTEHGLKPISNYSSDQISSEPGPDPKKILENIEKEVQTVREKLYQVVQQRLNSMVEISKSELWEWQIKLSKYVTNYYEENHNATVKALDEEIQKKLNSFISSLMLATNQAIENYSDNASDISKRLDGKMRDLNAKISEAERKVKAVVETKVDKNDVNTSSYDDKSILDLDGKKIDLFDDDDESLTLPKVEEV